MFFLIHELFAIKNSLLLIKTVFNCPRRPNLGREGRPIMLRANHFKISMQRDLVDHYDVKIEPEKCPQKINRKIIEILVNKYNDLFGDLRPVFDGRKNLFTKNPLPIGYDQIKLEVYIFLICIIITFNFIILEFRLNCPMKIERKYSVFISNGSLKYHYLI